VVVDQSAPSAYQSLLVLPELGFGATYFLRVQAVDPATGIGGTYSQPRRFTTAAPAAGLWFLHVFLTGCSEFCGISVDGTVVDDGTTFTFTTTPTLTGYRTPALTMTLTRSGTTFAGTAAGWAKARPAGMEINNETMVEGGRAIPAAVTARIGGQGGLEGDLTGLVHRQDSYGTPTCQGTYSWVLLPPP
jgi:hypothetical protein